ncbi:MAG: pantetheine-phosphate adenylyltransferase [Bacteroidetes bacterium GWF2_38_335]|nr:MAG: pantetheine-phosphate adenylyltransferase [Bacteroidetes bacterium GWF2_38_335]OFY78222.1 MAG: pantetheine-phosphate adenylyltransferase [Bacteroidetes bacterium RIFOXYA12_FULL_38_20]HBS88686.1 pantetheine-phosphate adenylyltransferase [Bacteroidales bacterium]
MEKIAIFPGSFDPFTKGHESIVNRALPLFDKIIIAIGYNSNKDGFFPLEKRMGWIKDVFKNEPKIVVEAYQGLTVDFCNRMKAKYILRGLRTAADFEYERAIAQTNKMLAKHIESVFLLTTPELTPINSTIVRDIVRNGGDASMFVPDAVDLKK